MGCGASVNSIASQGRAIPAPRDENVLICIKENRPLRQLPNCVAVLHDGMPGVYKQAPMRLLRISKVLAWKNLEVYEQYDSSPMVEIMRSKLFYIRARAMVIIPTFHAIPPGGIVRPLLSMAANSLKKRGHEAPNGVVAAKVISSILAREQVAGREYFSRVWTLAERMARHGRSEQLCNWLSLEAWLGMVIDAMLKSTEDRTASQIYKKILGKDAGDLLDKILNPLADAVKTSSMFVAEGLEEMVAQLFEMAVNMWKSQSILEEAPTRPWLLSYLEEAHTGVYQACSEGDRVWAVYSYFCWKQLDQLEPLSLLVALQDLVHVAGAHRRHMLGLARCLGVARLLPVEEMEVGDVSMVQPLIEQGANTQLANEKDDGVTAEEVMLLDAGGSKNVKLKTTDKREDPKRESIPGKKQRTDAGPSRPGPSKPTQNGETSIFSEHLKRNLSSLEWAAYKKNGLCIKCGHGGHLARDCVKAAVAKVE